MDRAHTAAAGQPDPAVAADAAMGWATPASLTRRYTADAIDAAIIFASIALLAALAVAVGGNALLLVVVLAWPLSDILYRVLLMRRSGERNGQTLGRELLSVRVATVSGRPLTGGDAALREILWKSFVFGSLGSCLLGIPMLLDLLSPLWHPRRRAWHDQLCETVVVDARTTAAPQPATVAPAAAAAVAAVGDPAAPVGQPLAFDPPGAAPPPPPAPTPPPAPPTAPVAASPPPPAPQPPPPDRDGRGRGLLVFAVLALAAVLAAAGAFAVTQLRDGSDADSAELSRDDWFAGGGGVDEAVEDDGSEESETSEDEGEAVLPDLSEEEMAAEIGDVLLAHHTAIAESDFQRAWETLSSRKRRQYRNEEQGYSTWRENQTTLTSYLDPDDLEVEILGVNEADGVVTVRVTGMGWSAPGSDCTEWSGITWVKFEHGGWYYDPGYSTTPTRERSWKSRYGKLLGGSC